jgi:XTP/dITP diphosphohydrolase
MSKIYFATTNEIKFKSAQEPCKKYGLELEQVYIEVDEIQSENSTKIIEDKVTKVFAQLNHPVLVSDDSWNIPALNGFPGPYMKSINSWFTGQDWVNLMLPHKNKKIYLNNLLAFTDDGINITIFEGTSERVFLTKPSPKPGIPVLQATSLPSHTKPLNEMWSEDSAPVIRSNKVWEDFAKWYKETYS